jgi:hypothetical protein
MNLMQDEIKSFEEVGFVLNKQQPIFFKIYLEKKAPFL